MLKQLGVFLGLLVATVAGFAAEPVGVNSSAVAEGALAKTPAPGAAKLKVYVIPVQDQIASPTVYILRRGLKEAIEQKVDVVLLDMDTPGGALDQMLEAMKALDRFTGKTITFVNEEATSAGALIAAVTDDIYFAPRATMGSAEPVTGQGGDIDESMKRKVMSYMSAKVDAYLDTNPRRSDVIKAMIDPNFELKIGETLIKPKGELLNVSASKANTLFGEPPTPLLASGIAADVDALLTAKFGAGNYEIKQFEVTWSERAAQYLSKVAPFLLGLGLLALYVEFKTPGFGVFGVTGIVLLGIVFLGNYVAGFSGHEPLILFALGVLLVAVELFFFPGIVVVALTGIALMLGSLVWAMADLWPGEPLSVAWSADVFVQPLQTLGLGLLLSVVFGVALAKFIPKGWVWDKMVVESAIGGAAQVGGGAPDAAVGLASLVGRQGVAVTMLRPSGQVEIEGRRYEAKSEIGIVDSGDVIVVCGRSDFGLIVEKAKL